MTVRQKGCGWPSCRSCMSLEGRGPWCPRCGRNLQKHYPAAPNDVIWANDLCPQCDVIFTAEMATKPPTKKPPYKKTPAKKKPAAKKSTIQTTAGHLTFYPLNDNGAPMATYDLTVGKFNQTNS